MNIIQVSKSFIIKAKHTLMLNGDILDSDNNISFWDPITGTFVEHHFFERESMVKHDMEYYDLCDNGKLYYTPLLYGSRYQTINLPLLSCVLNTNLDSLVEVLRFPFRTNQYPYYDLSGIETDIIKEFHDSQNALRKIFVRISDKKMGNISDLRKRIISSEITAYPNYFYQELSTDKLFNLTLNKQWTTVKERNSDPTFIQWIHKPFKITVFDGWDSYLYWELLTQIESDRRITVCKHCGRFLTIKKGGHRDRQLCTKEENPDCCRNRQKIIKAKQRQKLHK